MLLRYRRYFAILSFLLLATPLVAGLVSPDGPGAILKEGRRMAPAPQAPGNWEGLLALPAQVDAYLKDRFGLRQKMIRLHTDLTKPVFAKRGNSQVLIGRDGRMFYQGDEMVRQSAGLVLREERVSDSADMLASMRDALARRGTRFLVAVPPNSSTIYQDDLPLWAQNKGRPTEYDLFLEDLAAHGVKAVDLRPALRAVRAEGPAYRMFDSHWTARGALAAFNAIMEADAHPDWRLDPASALGSLTPLKGGDVARILGVVDSVAETDEEFALRAGKTRKLAPATSQDYEQTSDTPGPTIMIIGDSFTIEYFAPMLMPHAGRVVWMHHQLCGFDWKWIDKLHPDEVWWMPTERFLVCNPGARPLDFAG